MPAAEFWTVRARRLESEAGSDTLSVRDGTSTEGASMRALREWHRDFGYFYLGLIIAFATSGIALNHRRSFDPQEYVYVHQEFDATFPEILDEATAKTLFEGLGLDDEFRGYRDDRRGKRIFAEHGIVQLDPEEGNAVYEIYKTRPLLGQFTTLHQSTDKFWIYYSDMFGLTMLFMACSGMLMLKGQNSFRRRGWKLSLTGILFPLIFLFLLR
jgi:hypothetical protein